MSRKEKLLSGLSEIGKETLCRAKLEAERRLCGNYSAVVSDAPFVKSHHGMIMLQLDMRTIRSQHM